MLAKKVSLFNRLISVFFAVVFVSVININIVNASVLGYWETIDDETNQPKSIIKIEQQGTGEYIAKVVKILKTDDGSDPETRKCDKCSGERYNQPIKGMTIMQNVKQVGDNEWSGGEILDPKTGKTYNVKFSLDETKNKLNVRGYLGFSLFGRTQVWHRLNSSAYE